MDKKTLNEEGRATIEAYQQARKALIAAKSAAAVIPRQGDWKALKEHAEAQEGLKKADAAVLKARHECDAFRRKLDKIQAEVQKERSNIDPAQLDPLGLEMLKDKSLTFADLETLAKKYDNNPYMGRKVAAAAGERAAAAGDPGERQRLNVLAWQLKEAANAPRRDALKASSDLIQLYDRSLEYRNLAAWDNSIEPLLSAVEGGLNGTVAE